MEIHDIGPTKIFDTPGINEEGELGEKKRQKALISLKESDLCLFVINPFEKENKKRLMEFLKISKEHEKTNLILFNVKKQDLLESKVDLNETIEKIEEEIDIKEEDVNVKIFDFHSPDSYTKIIEYIKESFNKVKFLPKVEVLPSIEKDSIVFLNIPMDAETPSGRLLKPQSMIQEHLLRNEVSTFCYRMDLKKGRSENIEESESEKQRFLEKISMMSNKLKLVITDSQAIDLVSKYMNSNELTKGISYTTFSVTMINFMSGINHSNKKVED
jgi:hypothetical protein